MPTTQAGLLCPIDGKFPITLTPITVNAGDVPQAIQWQCTNDPTHTDIILGNPNSPGKGTKFGGFVSDALANFFNKQPTVSQDFQLDDGDIYIQRLMKPMIANIGPTPGQSTGFNTSPIAQGISAALALVTGVNSGGGELPGSSGQRIIPIVGDMI